MSKKCNGCGLVKANVSFGKDISKADGMRGNCRECKNKADQKWRGKNYVMFRTKNTALMKKKGRQYELKYKYNLTLEQYHTMLDEREHKCDICQNVMSKPNVDHCHTTNKIRGILCTNCNTALGKFKDDVDMLQRAIDYLNKYK